MPLQELLWYDQFKILYIPRQQCCAKLWNDWFLKINIRPKRNFPKMWTRSSYTVYETGLNPLKWHCCNKVANNDIKIGVADSVKHVRYIDNHCPGLATDIVWTGHLFWMWNIIVKNLSVCKCNSVHTWSSQSPKRRSQPITVHVSYAAGSSTPRRQGLSAYLVRKYQFGVSEETQPEDRPAI